MLIRTLASLSCILGIGLAAEGGDGKADNTGKSCSHLAPVSCDTIRIYSDAELEDTQFLKVRDFDLDPRNVDLSSLDDDTVNITQLVRRDDLGHLDGPDLHFRVEELLGLLGKHDIVEAYQLLTRAAQKRPDGEYEICKDSPKADKKKNNVHFREDISMLYHTSPYTQGVDIYDCTDWSNCENFKFQKGGQESPRKSYVNEHVLERQMLQQFFHAEIEDRAPDVPMDGYKDLCHMMRKYWWAKDGKEKKEKPETFVNGVQAWDFVGAAWPNKQQAAEMPRVESQLNGMKARSFKSGTSIKDMEGTRAWFSDEKRDPSAIYDVRDDLVALKESVRTGLFVTSYMNHPDIQKIYKDQAERVAVALGEAEDALVQNWSTNKTPYKKQNLDAKFRAWMRKYTKEVSEKLEEHINLCEGFLRAQVKRSENPRLKLSADEKRLIREMEETVKEANKMKEGFKNPF